MAVVVPVISTFDSRGITKAIADFKKLDKAGQRSAFVLLNANKAVNSLSTSLAKFGGIAVGVSAVVGNSLVMAASTLQESMSKVNAVFGESSASVISWSETTAKSLGIAQSAALEAAGTYGNLFQAFGLTQQQAQEMSVRLVELAADMASFNNTPVDEALKALASGLSGETEPMKKYGSVLSDVRLKEEALRLKLIQTSTGTLPVAIKAQAAYSLILKDTAIQQGDVARTSSGLAFQMKSLGAQFEDVKATIGTALIPVATKLTTYINQNMLPALTTFGNVLGEEGVGAAINYLNGAIISGLFNMGAFGKTVLVVGSAVVALKTAVVTFSAVQGILTLAVKVTTGALQAQLVALNATRVALLAAGGVTALLAVAGTLYAAYATIKSKAVKETEKFSDALYGEAEAQRQAITSLMLSDPVFQDLISLSTAYGLQVSDLQQYLTTGTGKFDEFQVILGVAAGQTGKLSDHTQMLGERFVNAAKAANIEGQELDNLYFKLEALGKQGFATRTAGELAKSFGLTASSASSAGKAIETASEKFKKFKDSARSAADATRSVRDATKDAGDAQKDLQKTTDALAVAQDKFNKITSGYGANSKQGVDAQKDLTEANRAAARAQLDLEKANFAVTDAEKALRDARRTGTPREIRDAEIALQEAVIAQAEAQDNLTAAIDAQETAQTKLNEAVSGAATDSQTYKDALLDLQSAQDAQSDAIDRVRDAKERELDVTRNLAKAEILLKKARGKLTKSQLRRANQLLADLNTPVTVNVPTASAVPLAQGGIVTKPTLSLIGEGGEPESVIPLSKMRDTMGGGITVNITAGMGDPVEIGRQVVTALQAYQRRSGSLPLKVG